MNTLQQALSQLVNNGVITTDEAVYKSNRPNILRGLLDENSTSTNSNENI